MKHDDEGGADGDGLAKHVSGGAGLLSSAPLEMMRVARHRYFVSSNTMPNCSTGWAPYLRHQPSRQIARRRELPALVERPASRSGGPVRARPAPARPVRARRRRPGTTPPRSAAAARAPRRRAPAAPSPVRARSSSGVPWPSTSASNSLSPSPPAPTRVNFSRGRSSGASDLTDAAKASRPCVYSGAMPRLVALVSACLCRRRRRRMRRSAEQGTPPGAGRHRRRPRGRRRQLRHRRVHGRRRGAGPCRNGCGPARLPARPEPGARQP